MRLQTSYDGSSVTKQGMFFPQREIKYKNKQKQVFSPSHVPCTHALLSDIYIPDFHKDTGPFFTSMMVPSVLSPQALMRPYPLER